MRRELKAIAPLIAFAGCAGTGVVKPSEKASMYKLDSEYKIESMHSGESVEVDTSLKSNRILFRRPGAVDEVLLVIFPDAMEDELQIKLEKPDSAVFRSDVNRQYLDSSLQVHREILRGDLKQAAGHLDELRRRFGETFSFHYFSGLIAAAEGRSADALAAFSLARDLNPAASELEGFVSDLTAKMQQGGGQ